MPEWINEKGIALPTITARESHRRPSASRESHWNYIGRRLQEDRMTEIDIYKKNIADLQEQLQKSYIKQKTFLDELNELQKRKTISLAMEMKQFNFDFNPIDEK